MFHLCFGLSDHLKALLDFVFGSRRRVKKVRIFRAWFSQYGLRRPTRACQIFVYRAFDLWSQMGPMYRATVSVSQFMIPDEILWRIAVYWPDLGNHWHEASWRLHRLPVGIVLAWSCPSMKWPIDLMGCWKSHRVTYAMSGQRCYPQRSICLSCKSSSRHFVGVDGLWCGVLAPTIGCP